MIAIREAVFPDLLYIATKLCDEDRVELEASHSPLNLLTLATDAAASPYKHIATIDGVPVIAFGAIPLEEQPDLAIVWGFKTDAGRRAIRQVTKFIRKTMIPSLLALGIKRATCLVHQDNAPSIRWLGHLGFKPEATLVGIGAHGEDMLLFCREEPDALSP